MSEELDKLKCQRRSYKGNLTRFSKFMEVEIVDLAQLKIRLEKFESLLSKYESGQSEIEFMEQNEDPNDRETFENSYYSSLTKAKSLLQETVVASPQPISEDYQLSKQKLVKLPTIELPTFSGEYEQYRSFVESFNSLIGNRTDLDGIQRFHYLRSSLKGDALDVIGSLDINETNYTVAWELLQQRYDNHRLVVNRHMKAIFNTEKIERESSLKVRLMLDTVMKHYKALESLNVPVKFWDVPLVFILSQKLDPRTFREWESLCDKDSYPTFANFIEFLQNQAHLLESLEGEKQTRSAKGAFGTKPQTNHAALESPNSDNPQKGKDASKCPICLNFFHKVFNCRKFLLASIPNRQSMLSKTSICSNCLSGVHKSEDCSKRPCPMCGKKHNSLLHIGNPIMANVGTDSKDNLDDEGANEVEQNIAHSVSAAHPKQSTIVLSTAVVHIIDKYGKVQPCRVLLDSGSQVNCMTGRMAGILGLPCRQTQSTICGIGGVVTGGCKTLTCHISSKDSQYHCDLECIIMPKITLPLPTLDIDISSWNIPVQIQLADPNFNKRAQVDLLIGAGEFYNIIGGGQFPIGPNLPVLQWSKLGWIVAGRMSPSIPESPNSNYSTLVTCHLTLEEAVSKFWETEEVSPIRRMNEEEKQCENCFISTTIRDESGRFVVHLPTRSNLAELGNSQEIALRRFLALEKRLARSPDLKNQYTDFMREYFNLGHMDLAPEPEPGSLVYYLPHHAVVNEASSTTKLRVVFDASCKSSSGLSLNETLLVGPVIQQDLVSIVLRFRKHRYVITADITKMYRQIKVVPNHQNLQLIYWRENPYEDIKTYRLKTVTYGTGPASFLATRCLQELSEIHHDAYPLGSRSVAHDFYMDDLLTGGNTLEETQLLQKQIMAILNDAQFELHKWCSNDPLLLESIPLNKREKKYELSMENHSAVKTLGIWWNPVEDSFKYSINLAILPVLTRRGAISEIARIFDPLGLLGPVNFKAKTIMRKICKGSKDWDSPLSGALLEEWLDFRQQLPNLEELEIPRRVVLPDAISVELHGFSDASEQGFGASIYLRSVDAGGKVQVQLLCAKSKLAPAGAVSMPRLELSGAVLLASLARKSRVALDMPTSSCHLWTDSTVALAWISQPSGCWKTYVANRVTEINDLTRGCEWHHVPGSDNPSDELSRGLTPLGILHSSLWWNGPSWLWLPMDSWPSMPSLPTRDLPEAKKQAVLVSTKQHPVIEYSRFSRYNQLINTMVYVLRFVDHLPNKPCVVGPISVEERERGLRVIVRLVQDEAFKKEIHDLLVNGRIAKKSVLRSVNPFIDTDGQLRVGGRLEKSDLDFDSKHQIILPSSHRFTTLLVEHLHRKNAHAGPRLLVATIRQQFWPLHALGLVRKIFHQCVICFRHRPRAMKQLMGQLPRERVQSVRPFINTGVDFCGPVWIKASNLRNAKSIKAYVAVFVCLSTKAVHVELVGDISTESFINALKRFFARRGKSRAMFSDNGTNFVGAAKELRKNLEFVLKNEQVVNYTANEGVSWKFIPPRAPHFGGLWESAIKSLKYHLKHIVGDSIYTYEEMITFLAMVESFLNSRPLLPLSDDPTDLQALTPGHFLTGDALTAAVEPDLTTYNGGLLRRWRRIQKMYQLFWARWSQEYLTTLQERTKWTASSPNLRENQLVLIKNENLPPLKWNLGRVIEVNPGNDGLTRVAVIKTSSGILKRPIHKLCPLPEDRDENNDEPSEETKGSTQCLFHVVLGYKFKY